MRRRNIVSGLVLALMLSAPSSGSVAQGKGYGQGKADRAQGRGGKAQDAKPGQGKGQAAKQGRASEARGVAAKGRGSERAPVARSVGSDRERPERMGQGRGQAREIDEFGGEVERGGFRILAASNKHGEKMAGRAIARATRRGLSEDAFVFTPVGNRVYILNRSGALLVNLVNDRDIGTWRAVTLRDTDKRGSPSFCRSGAGHPVWGRQWCLDKGFGLGIDQNVRWSRVIDFDNVVFRRVATTEDLTRAVLVDVLGDLVLNRLATHAITLGLVQPLTGRWLGEPQSTRVLLLSSGTQPVAEIVDLNRDNRADVILVAVRPD